MRLSSPRVSVGAGRPTKGVAGMRWPRPVLTAAPPCLPLPQPSAPLPRSQRAGPDLKNPRHHRHTCGEDSHQVQTGAGIPLLTANLSPKCLSLLHAMVAYDPDERIAAHQALQHPYFQDQRAAEKQALASHRKSVFSERPVAPELLLNGWQISKEGRKQKPSLKSEEDPPTRQGPACLMQLPKLKLSGVTELASYPSPALHSVFGPGANSRVPVPRPLKFVGTNQKADPQKDVKPNLKQCRLPSIGRRGGRY